VIKTTTRDTGLYRAVKMSATDPADMLELLRQVPSLDVGSVLSGFESEAVALLAVHDSQDARDMLVYAKMYRELGNPLYLIWLTQAHERMLLRPAEPLVQSGRQRRKSLAKGRKERHRSAKERGRELREQAVCLWAERPCDSLTEIRRRIIAKEHDAGRRLSIHTISKYTKNLKRPAQKSESVELAMHYVPTCIELPAKVASHNRHDGRFGQT